MLVGFKVGVASLILRSLILVGGLVGVASLVSVRALVSVAGRLMSTGSFLPLCKLLRLFPVGTVDTVCAYMECSNLVYEPSTCDFYN